MEITGKLCMEEKTSSRLGRRVPAILAAHVVMGFAVVLMRLSLFGNDPFSCMNLGYAGVSGLSYGTCVIIFNLALIIPVALLDRSYLRFGTLINMFMLGIVGLGTLVLACGTGPLIEFFNQKVSLPLLHGERH